MRFFQRSNLDQRQQSTVHCATRGIRKNPHQVPATSVVLAGTFITWIVISVFVAALVDIALTFRRAASVIEVDLLHIDELTPFAAIAIGLALTTTARAWAVLVISLLGAVPVAVVLTVRRRAVLAGDPGHPLRVTVVTNMYPTDDHPYYGIFVARRVASYESLGAAVTVVSSARDSGWRNYDLDLQG